MSTYLQLLTTLVVYVCMKRTRLVLTDKTTEEDVAGITGALQLYLLDLRPGPLLRQIRVTDPSTEVQYMAGKVIDTLSNKWRDKKTATDS